MSAAERPVDGLRFRPLPKIRQSLLQEIIFQVASLNPEYPFSFILEGDDPDAHIETITYRRFISDVFKVAQRLSEHIPKRRIGDAPLYIGILGRSGYNYAVHWVACHFNSWIVSLSLFYPLQ